MKVQEDSMKDRKQRKRGIPADYRGATPEQVARAMFGLPPKPPPDVEIVRVEPQERKPEPAREPVETRPA